LVGNPAKRQGSSPSAARAQDALQYTRIRLPSGAEDFVLHYAAGNGNLGEIAAIF
jgi:hypothetical protein